MPRKTVRARDRLARGQFTIPSPADVVTSRTKRGAWSAEQLAEWGVPWPPPKGWRYELRKRYEAQQRGEPLSPMPAVPAPPAKIGPRRPNGKADRLRRAQARADGVYDETSAFKCEVCGIKTDAVVVTDGMKPDGTLNVRCFCGREHASRAGFHYFGFPSGAVSKHQQPDGSPWPRIARRPL